MRLASVLLVIVFLIACGKKETTDKASSSIPEASSKASTETPSQKVILSGQVFVVTKGRANIKLALVEVVAIPKKEIEEHLKARRNKRAEQLELLKAELESLRPKSELLRKKTKDALASMKTADEMSTATLTYIDGDYVRKGGGALLRIT
jgi:hypothetical protein